jgi:serine protease Do
MKRSVLVLACVTLGGLLTYVGQPLLQGRPADDALGAKRPQAPDAALPRELTSYRDVVKRVLPAVVSVESQARNGRRTRRAGDMDLPGEARRFLDAPRGQRDSDDDALPRIGFGSGFLVDPKGVVVTNSHVVAGADQVVVETADGKKFLSRTFHSDPMSDLAVVLLKGAEGLPYLEFGDSDAMEIGDRVLAVGAPFGLTGTVTHGIISSKGRSLRMNFYEDFLQTDAAINPGNSGGPLVNLEGKVIGVNSAIKSRSGGFQGIGLAISSNLGRSIVKQLLKDGVVHRGYLGVSILDLNEETAKEMDLKATSGVVVTRLRPDGPGANGGLKAGDVIVRIGGKPVRNGRELQMIVAGLPVGKEAEVEVIRDGGKRKLGVTIEEQPDRFGQ